MMKVEMMKKALVALVLTATPALAFAGGPVSHLPVKAQLHQEERDIHADIAAIRHGIPAAKMTQVVQRLDFELQNTAAQMHVKADFTHKASALLKKPDRAALLKNLEQDQRWVSGQ